MARRSTPGHLRSPPRTPITLRVRYYVDGFNLYHGMKEHTKARAYRWLNLHSLAQHFLMPGHQLERILYFTSIPPWNRTKAARHETYIAALENVGVEVIRGRFQKDEKECFATCRELFTVYSEKLTDVNIATSMLRDGVQDKYDWAYLVSGDADQAPVIRALRVLMPKKRVRVLFPPRRDSAELRSLAACSVGPIGWRVLKEHQFPDKITAGARIIQKPSLWAHPEVADATQEIGQAESGSAE
jgi:hypothetical protein